MLDDLNIFWICSESVFCESRIYQGHVDQSLVLESKNAINDAVLAIPSHTFFSSDAFDQAMEYERGKLHN